MEKLCKNCKYFKRHEDSAYSSKFGNCICSKFIYGSAYENTKKADELFYEDYESYMAFFEVGENFGCIHWKEN